jgi:hypothetical protein
VNWFWPIHTGRSFFDYWSLSHAAFWFVVGSTLAATKINRLHAYLCCLGIAFMWEVFERFAEKQWPTIWLSPESWYNAWISDILMTGLVLLAFYGFDRWRPT